MSHVDSYRGPITGGGKDAGGVNHNVTRGVGGDTKSGRWARNARDRSCAINISNRPPGAADDTTIRGVNNNIASIISRNAEGILGTGDASNAICAIYFNNLPASRNCWGSGIGNVSASVKSDTKRILVVTSDACQTAIVGSKRRWVAGGAGSVELAVGGRDSDF